jgi:hypothetical protein
MTREALPPLWTCPKCSAQFVSANMWHSCGRRSVEDLFARSDPHVFKLYLKFKRMVEGCGPVTMIPQKTRLVFMVRMRFAGFTVRKSGLRGIDPGASTRARSATREGRRVRSAELRALLQNRAGGTARCHDAALDSGGLRLRHAEEFRAWGQRGEAENLNTVSGIGIWHRTRARRPSSNHTSPSSQNLPRRRCLCQDLSHHHAGYQQSA